MMFKILRIIDLDFLIGLMFEEELHTLIYWNCFLELSSLNIFVNGIKIQWKHFAVIFKQII
jgi:hypothetical protein